MTDDTRSGIQADNYFAIIPEWVLYAKISSNAVRLYGALQRHADPHGHCFPSRRRLTALLWVSESTLDRCMKELVDLGAVEVYRRTSPEGDFTSNRYLVRTVRGVASNLGGVASPVNPPGVMGEATGGVTSDELIKAIVEQSHESENMPTVSVGEKVAPSDFDLFWNTYPRKVGKTKALKVWVKLSKGDKTAALQALPEHVTLWRVRQVAAEFIPHPTSWLNGRRWEDELLPQQQVVPAFTASRSAPGMGLIKHIISNSAQKELGS